MYISGTRWHFIRRRCLLYLLEASNGKRKQTNGFLHQASDQTVRLFPAAASAFLWFLNGHKDDFVLYSVWLKIQKFENGSRELHPFIYLDQNIIFYIEHKTVKNLCLFLLVLHQPLCATLSASRL